MLSSLGFSEKPLQMLSPSGQCPEQEVDVYDSLGICRFNSVQVCKLAQAGQSSCSVLQLRLGLQGCVLHMSHTTSVLCF